MATQRLNYGRGRSRSAKGGQAGGLLMFFAATVLLFWNEGNFVKTKKSIQEAEEAVVIVDNVSSVDASLNGKLIHATAFADTKETLTDRQFGISETAIALHRDVSYYQWVERESTIEDDDGNRQITYDYQKQWVAKPVASGNFHDLYYRNSNFTLTGVETKSQLAKEVSFGAYLLPVFIITSISGSEPAEVKLSNDELEQYEKEVADILRKRGKNPSQQPGTAPHAMVHVNGNTVYYGTSPNTPAIGDVRVRLSKIMPADVSVIARVNSNTFEKFVAKNGKTFSAVAMGTVSAANMFAGAHSTNQMITWVLRLLGILMMIGGLKSMFSLLTKLFNKIPVLGSIISGGVGIVCVVAGAAWSLLIIALSWLFYRPLTGILLLAVALAGVWLLKKSGEKKQVNN